MLERNKVFIRSICLQIAFADAISTSKESTNIIGFLPFKNSFFSDIFISNNMVFPVLTLFFPTSGCWLDIDAASADLAVVVFVNLFLALSRHTTEMIVQARLRNQQVLGFMLVVQRGWRAIELI